MSKGRRYDSAEPKLNFKKVLGVMIAVIVVISIIISLVKIIKSSKNKDVVINKTYYTVYNDGKYGVIDQDGNIVINPEYIEMISIPNKSKAIFVCVYNINDQDGTYETKVINAKNEQILTGYDKIEAIDNYDSKQNVWYEDNLLRVFRNNKYGLINFEGTEILACEYDEITALKGVKNNILVKKDGKIGLVNEKGQTIIKTEYKEILTLKEGYQNEYIVINENNTYGVISAAGTVLVEPKFEQVKYLYSSTLFAVKEAGVWKVINTEGTIIIDGGYTDITQAKGDNIIVVKDGKYGVITATKEQKVPMEYEELKYAFSVYYIAKKDGKYGVINIENEAIINFEYLNMVYVEKGGFIQADKTETETVIFDNNLAIKITGIISEVNLDLGYIKAYVDNEYKYYNFKFEEKNTGDLLTANTLFLSKKDGKYGYLNNSGKIVIDYIYDDATEQNSCGYAAVKKDGVWGSINKIGAESLKPSVNLDNSIYINFIGEWHLNDNGLYYEK